MVIVDLGIPPDFNLEAGDFAEMFGAKKIQKFEIDQVRACGQEAWREGIVSVQGCQTAKESAKRKVNGAEYECGSDKGTFDYAGQA
jgi:hypothetical protein